MERAVGSTIERINVNRLIVIGSSDNKGHQLINKTEEMRVKRVLYEASGRNLMKRSAFVPH